jgi:Protein of unknown function (DUF2795)
MGITLATSSDLDQPTGATMIEPSVQSLRIVLAGLRFPAERWEIVTTADMYGVDAATCELLRRLPLRSGPYRNIQDIVEALGSVPVPPTR